MIHHAIVGCSDVAANHADAFRRIPGVRLRWACDLVPERAKGLSERFHIPRTTGSFEEVIADPEVGSVSLVVPHDVHGSLALQALAQGKHVLVEKPFVMRPEQGVAVVAAAAAAGRVVMPVSQHRFDPVVRFVSALLAAGELGQVRMVRGHLECLRPRAYYSGSDWRGTWAREGGSVLMNQAYHLVDLLLQMAGPVTQASARMATLEHKGTIETEDSLVASLEFGSGALGVLSVGGAAGREWNSYLELAGSRGVVAFDLGTPNRLLRLEPERLGAAQRWRRRWEKLSTKTWGRVSKSYYGFSHRAQARAFVDRIQGRPADGAATPEEAIEAVRLIERLYESARPVAAPDPQIQRLAEALRDG